MENKNFTDMNEEELTILINQYRDSANDSPVIINGHYSSEPDYTDMNEKQLDEVIQSFEKHTNSSVIRK